MFRFDLMVEVMVVMTKVVGSESNCEVILGVAVGAGQW